MAFGSDTARYLEMTIILRAVNQSGTAFSNVALAATAMAAAIGAGLAYSVKAAADFQTGLVTLATGAGEARDKLQMVGDGIKQISIDTATSTDDLLKGMFMIESGGYRAQDGLNILKIAAEGSKAENADLGKTAFALTGLLHDYGMKSTQAAAAMNGLVQTEADGKMKMQDLTTSLGAVLPLASALHISFPQVGAAIAVMTNSNMTAARASQNLNFALRALEAPGNTALDAMTAVGLSADQIIKTLSGPNGLADALTLIEDHVGKTFPAGSAAFNTALKDIMGGATGWNVAVKLSGQHLQELEADTRNITSAMGNASSAVKNWDLIQSTFNFKLGQMQQGLNVAAIDLGTLLLPALGKVLGAIVPLVGKFTTWVETSQGLHSAIQNVANFLAGTLIPTVSDGVGRLGDFVQWMQQGSPAANALQDAMITLAYAVGLVKLAGLVTAMRDFVVGVPNMVASFFLVGNAAAGVEVAEAAAAKAADALTAAQARLGAQAELTAAQISSVSAASTGMTSSAMESQVAQIIAGTLPMGAADAAAQKVAAARIAATEAAAEKMATAQAAVDAAQTEVAAKQAAVEAATATAGSLTLGGVITAVGGVAFIEGMVAKWIRDNNIVPAAGMADTVQKTQDAFNKLGNSAADNQARMEADAVIRAAGVKGEWSSAERQIALASANTKAQFILDQQEMRDAAAKYASDAAQSWSNFVSSMEQQGINPITGGKWSPTSGTQRGGPHGPSGNGISLVPVSVGVGGFRAPGHASGIFNSAFGHFAMVGERGPELMYVPKGSSIYPHGTGPGGTTINVHVSTMAGSRAEVSRMVDLIERELAGRFRSQTPNFGYAGIV